jgi:probable HAF family extracellular repeat protein
MRVYSALRLMLAVVGSAACASDLPTTPPESRGGLRASVGVTDAIVAVRAPIDLGNLTTQPGTLGSIAWDVNAGGWVVGEAHTADATRAFLWRPGSGMENLGTLEPTDTYSRAEGINDAGWVVGTSGSGGTSEAVLWRSGQPPVALGIPGGRSEAIAISNSGQIVGAYQVGSATRAFSWQNGVFRDLETLGGGEARAFGVNDAGVVVGGSRKANSIGEEAVAWAPGDAPRDLGVTAAVVAGRSVARDINTHGEVVGIAFPPANGLAPFILRPGTGASLLADPRVTGGEAYAIDDEGRAVGYLLNEAILWHPVAGQIQLPKLAGATSHAARGISNAGYIAGYARVGKVETRAVRWQLDRAPVANAGGPYVGAKKKPVGFDATRSADPDGDVLTYTWDFGDGSPPVSGAISTHEYGTWGAYRVTLKVSDPYGLSATDTTTATIAPPGHLKKP